MMRTNPWIVVYLNGADEYCVSRFPTKEKALEGAKAVVSSSEHGVSICKWVGEVAMPAEPIVLWEEVE